MRLTEIDPATMSITEKVEVIKESDGLLVHLLDGQNYTGTNVSDLSLGSLGALTSVPRDITLDTLRMEYCDGVKAADFGDSHGRAFSIFTCRNLEEISGITVSGAIKVTGCGSLKKLSNITCDTLLITYCLELVELENVNVKLRLTALGDSKLEGIDAGKIPGLSGGCSIGYCKSGGNTFESVNDGSG